MSETCVSDSEEFQDALGPLLAALNSGCMPRPARKSAGLVGGQGALSIRESLRHDNHTERNALNAFHPYDNDTNNFNTLAIATDETHRLRAPSIRLQGQPANPYTALRMAENENESGHVEEPKNFTPKNPPKLDPPKDDPISVEELAKCDGKNAL